ncbi:hypothetical protein EKO27_g3254 [Xylaria grammica]|uniref:DUF7918 domain-containing protein n=1 Tax=Xylaria grammica TaxID=363999 RepID=A0A439DBT2_9PEZI|nr:hypothetical protein EKO27_g3254 [Xylaria grammica]
MATDISLRRGNIGLRTRSWVDGLARPCSGVAGRDAIEYDADEEVKQSLAERATCPTVTKYIECIDEFAIRVTARRDYEWGYKKHVLRIGVSIDGDYTCSETISGPADDPHEECLENDLKVVKQLGLIRVTVQRCVVLPRRARRAGRLPVNTTRKFELSVKSLKAKAISHGTAFSAPRVTKAPRCSRSSPLPEDNGPIAIFDFLYRSKDALQQNLVIPRDPSFSSSSTFSKLLPAEIKRRKSYFTLEKEDLNWKKAGIANNGWA